MLNEHEEVVMKKIRFALVICLVGLGCSVSKDMSNMVDTAGAMNEKTGQMRNSLENLCQGGREDAMSKVVPAASDKIRHVAHIHDKLIAAAQYIYGFEFQHWKICYDTDLEFRQQLFAKALRYLFVDTADLFQYSRRFKRWAHDFEIDPGFFPPTDNWRSLAAISFVIGENDPNHTQTALEKNFSPVTFYTLIKDGLKAREKLENNEALTEPEKVVLQFEHQAEDLLQLRHNFLPLMAISDLDSFGNAWLTQVRFRFTHWIFDIDKFNLVQLDQQIEFLNQAKETREFLEKHGIAIQWYENLRQIYSHVQFVSKRSFIAQQILNGEEIDPDSVLGPLELKAQIYRELWKKIAAPKPERRVYEDYN